MAICAAEARGHVLAPRDVGVELVLEPCASCPCSPRVSDSARIWKLRVLVAVDGVAAALDDGVAAGDLAASLRTSATVAGRGGRERHLRAALEVDAEVEAA